MFDSPSPIAFRFSKNVPPHITRVMFHDRKESYVQILPGEKKNILIGAKIKELNRRKLILLLRRIVMEAKANRISRLSVNLKDFLPASLVKEKDLAELLGEAAEMANFEFIKYKTPPKDGWTFLEEIWVTNASKEAEKSIKKGQIKAYEVNQCRILANTPGGEMTPGLLGEAAKKAAKGTAVKVKILDKKEIAKLGMGGVMGVSQGSKEEPKFIILEYKNAGREKPIVLVGKGVTFDTGGLNLKPSEHIYEMHMDMSGGAAVIHAIVLAAKLGVKKNVVGLIPAAENMPSGSSYRPGDILKSLSGKTIEVLNTDAEGRILLADGLAYAARYKPKLVVDVATLTGAAMSALGQRASAIFTPDQTLEDLFRKLGEESGDYVWPLPLWEEYEEEIKGTFGDVANLGNTRYGGAITAAAFLHQFAKEYPWVHIDIAPRMTATSDEFLAKGAVGAPVRLLIQLLESY